MKDRVGLAWMLVTLAWPPAALPQWVSVGDGIDYREYRLSNPDNDAYVARLDRANPNAIIESSIANDRIIGSREVVSAQAARQDDSISSWGSGGTAAWGQRNEVVVAINGSYYNSAGVITGGHLFSGWYAKRFDPNSGQSGFVWKRDRSCFLGYCTRLVAADQMITWTAGGTVQRIDGLNTARADNQLILYTPQYDAHTHTDSTGTEVIVQLAEPAGLTSSGVAGTVREVRPGQSSSYIPFDCVVLSAKGSPAATLLTKAQVGAALTIRQSVDAYGLFCQLPFPYSFENAFACTQGNHVYLRDSTIIPNSDAGFVARNPRTAIAFNSEYVFFIVVDGRSTRSLGMTITELGAFTRDVLGATDATNQDGGGSSTMVVNGVVKNVPSDGGERAVANGSMMVNLRPKVQSTRLGAGQPVSTATAAECRLGPGTNFTALASLAAGREGSIVDHALNGVYAKDQHWWKCDFGGTIGWVADSQLDGGPARIPGDFDGDRDVDQVDFGHLQACLDRLLVPARPDCADADLDRDVTGAVSQNDILVFLACMTAPGGAGDPDCAN